MAPDTPGAPEAVRVNGAADGVLVPWERGLHYGDGLFETLACIGGRPRFLELHLSRLSLGCARLGLPLVDIGPLRREVLELASQAQRAIVKVILTRGAALARGYGASGAEKPTRITLRYRWEPEDPGLAREGVRVRTAALRLAENPALAGLKHCNRLEQVLARREWSDPRIAEALMFTAAGQLIGGTMSNVFIVRGGRLLTPRVERCGVAGVMRQVVLREAARAGIEAAEVQLTAADLVGPAEILLTNALIGVRPVCALDGEARAPGPVTRVLQQGIAPLLEAGGDA